MATRNPRLSVLLTPRQHQVITSMSRDSGQSMSKIIQELIEPSMPVLERLAATFQHLRQAKDADRARVVKAAEDTQDVLEPILTKAVSQIDLFLGGLEQSFPINEASIDLAKSSRTRTSPPSTNRGGTPPHSKPPRSLQQKASRSISEKAVFQKKARASGGSKS
jgi:hypothetical protein